MKRITYKRCSICGAKILDTKSLCDVCESAYPCDKCTNKDKTVCECKRWKRWFSLQWEQFCRKSEK